MLTRLGAGALCMTTVVAYFMMHFPNGIAPHIFPSEGGFTAGGGEISILWFAIAGIIGIMGSRKYGLEHPILKKEILQPDLLAKPTSHKRPGVPYDAGQRVNMMQQQAARFGIYFNSSQNQVVRINSPYWFPPEPEWQKVTGEVNSTLLDLRRMIAEQGLSSDPDGVTWTTLPLLDEDN